MRLSNLIAAFAACGLCWPASSVALAAVRLGVIPFAPLAGDVPQGAGEKGAEILEKELKNQADFEVVPRTSSTSNAGAAAVTAARAKLAEARGLVAQHQGKAAVAAYQAALLEDGKGLSELDSFDEVITAEAELGMLFYRLGKDDDGHRALLEAERLSANQPLGALATAPTFAPQAEALQKQVAQAGKGSCRLDSTPEGADAYVDGQPAGRTPVLLRDLPEGRHYLRARLPSGEKWGAVVEIAARSEPHLRAQSGAEGPSADVSGSLSENNLLPAVTAALKKAAEAQHVAFLAFGALHRTVNGLALDPFLYSVERGKISRLKRVAFDAELLEAGLQMDKVVSEIQQHLAGDPSPLVLPAKVAPDLAAERELATEFHFGGVPDTLLDQPPAQNDAPPEEGHRVIRKHPSDAD